MKERNLFDVWVRVKPYQPSTGFSGDPQEDMPSPGLSCISRRRNSKSPRAKSPRTPRIWNGEKSSKKQDYKAFHVEGSQIVVEESIEETNKGSKLHQKTLSFPHIIDESESNISIFRKSLEPKVESVFEGCSFTLLTYGISGSGKSHTIFGSQTDLHQEKGLLCYFMQEIFHKKHHYEQHHHKKITVSLSFIEIYNEQARDLLCSDPSKRKLSIVESPFANGVMVPDLTIRQLSTYSELSACLGLILDKRVVSPNLNNHYSSRSHLIVEAVITTMPAGPYEGNKKVAKVRFVDLAGSEKVNMEAKDILQEGANINKSLLSLTNCITILSETKKRDDVFVPYRNSKLTRLLKDSLDGDTPVLMIVCISPNFCYLEETMNSLKYAQKAKKIKEHSRHNDANGGYIFGTPSHNRFQQSKIEQLEKELKHLQSALQLAEAENEAIKSKQVTNQNSGIISTTSTTKPAIFDFTKKNSSTAAIAKNMSEDKDEETTPRHTDPRVDEFDELMEALVENIDDMNALRGNLIEIDAMIVQNDSSIVQLQSELNTCKDYQQTQKLYKELKIVADKLEENLDIKENSLQEIDKLKQTIKCTKLALKKMYTTSLCNSQKESPTSPKTTSNPHDRTSDKNMARLQMSNGSDYPMLSSARDAKSLLEEIKRRDAQIASLGLALKNLSKQNPRSPFSTQLDIVEEKENSQVSCNADFNMKSSERSSSYSARLKENAELSNLETAAHSGKISMTNLLSSLTNLFNSGNNTAPAQSSQPDIKSAREAQKHQTPSLYLPLSQLPTLAANSQIQDPLPSANSHAEPNYPVSNTNPMSLISSSETRGQRFALQDLNTNLWPQSYHLSDRMYQEGVEKSPNALQYSHDDSLSLCAVAMPGGRLPHEGDLIVSRADRRIVHDFTR